MRGGADAVGNAAAGNDAGNVEHEVVNGLVLIKSAKNPTGYAGVYPYNQSDRFYAKYHSTHLGVYDTAKEAAHAYSKFKADAELAKLAFNNALAKKAKLEADAAKRPKAKGFKFIALPNTL